MTFRAVLKASAVLVLPPSDGRIRPTAANSAPWVPWSWRWKWIFGMDWKDIKKPPKCKLPKDFHHVNVYPSGTIQTWLLGQGWQESLQAVGIVDLMFEMQQRLGHPNPQVPANPVYSMYILDRERYDKLALNMAQKFTPGNFWDLAVESFELDPRNWISVNVVGDSSSYFKGPRNQRPNEPPSPPQAQIAELGLQCTCSCCAWMASYRGNDLRMCLSP